MLSLIKKITAILCVIAVSTTSFADYRETWNSNYSKNYYKDMQNKTKNSGNLTESGINEMKDTAPQYDESRTNSADVGDNDAAQQFYDYGTDLTNSCTVITTRETRELVCDNRTEYTYENVAVVQKRILDEIVWDAENYWSEKTVYRCALNGQTYENQAECANECQDSQSTDIVYTCPAGSYNPTRGVCETSPSCPNGGSYNTTTDRCEAPVTTSCPTGYTKNGSICQADPVCSSGTYNSSAKKCVIGATIGSCPAGYTEQGNQCVKTTTYDATAIFSCRLKLYDSYENSYENWWVFENQLYRDYNIGFYMGPIVIVSAWGETDTWAYEGVDKQLYTLVNPDSCEFRNNNDGSTLSVGSKRVWPPFLELSNISTFGSYSCPDGGTLNGNQCVITETIPHPSNSCFSGFTYDTTLQMCVKTPTCNNGGTFNASTNKCTISLTSSCPSGFTMSGSICYRAAYCIPGTTINGTTNMCTMQATTNFTCPEGYVKINDNTCLKTVACSDMPILEENTKYEASLIYRLEPESFSPLINCTFGSYSCVDSRNTCVSKTPPPESCLRNENICWTYERSGTCQRKITNIYTDCSYRISAQQIN